MVPSSIHQMYGRGNALYVAHYTQGLRVLDISNPENLDEVGYYDDRETMNITIGNENFLEKIRIIGIKVYMVFTRIQTVPG